MDLFSDHETRSIPHQEYLGTHGLFLKQLPVEQPTPTAKDPEPEPLPTWLVWPRKNCHESVITPRHAESLVEDGAASWGYTATEALAAYAKQHHLPRP